MSGPLHVLKTYAVVKGTGWKKFSINYTLNCWSIKVMIAEIAAIAKKCNGAASKDCTRY